MIVGNILDYVDWRGDVSFDEAPFNHVDNLILALISYVKLKNIVPEAGKRASITVQKAATEFFQNHNQDDLQKDESFVENTQLVLHKTAQSKRYGEARLCNYMDIFDEKKEVQFSAMHIMLDDYTTYIAFRGTDDTLVGWKEDFNMAYQMPVPAQELAVKYLNDTVKNGVRKLRVGGHSKGGNLAVYGAMMCKETVQKRILQIYNNDGPGFSKSVLQNPEYKRIKQRLVTIVPEGSIVGMLLEHEKDFIIVKSDEQGIMQHDGLSWQVFVDDFVEAKELTEQSRQVSEHISRWLATLDMQQRKIFVDALYTVLKKTGVGKISELTGESSSNHFRNMIALIKELSGLEDEYRQKLMQFIKVLRNES